MNQNNQPIISSIAPNIYDFANTEYAQDAFIAWMCSNYNQSVNEAKKTISEKFIKEILGVDIDFSYVKAETQFKKIDVLLTLTSGSEVYYVIIEDKTHSSHHDKQLERYVESVKKEKKTNEEHLFVVYYKTGHVLHTPDWLYCTNEGKYYYEPGMRSEYDIINDLRVNHGRIRRVTICDLKSLDDFFLSVSSQIKVSGSEILEDYSSIIHQYYSSYCSETIARDIKHTDELWARAFDSFIETRSNHYPDLIFKLGLWTGKYWEIYIAKNVPVTANGDPQEYDEPILNVRADIFEGKTKRIYFFFFQKLPNISNLSHREKDPKSATYVIPFGDLKRQNLNKIDFLDDEVTIENIHLLLDTICDEFERFVLRNTENLPFEL